MEHEDDNQDGQYQTAAVDPTEDIYIKTLSSFKFLINFEELQYNKKRDLIQKAGP